MVPDDEQTMPDDSDDGIGTVTDGSSGPGFDEASLYTVVRDAVEDALLDVIGTLLLVGVAFVLVVAGGQVLLQSGSLAGVAVGVGLLSVGLYIGAATLELVPPIREWV
jgi:hypothetical protein